MFSFLDDEKVQYFGLWAEEGKDHQKALAAIHVLSNAVQACTDRDVRTAEVDTVLAYVEKRSIRKHPVAQFRDAMGIPDPLQRKIAMTDAYVRISRALGLYQRAALKPLSRRAEQHGLPQLAPKKAPPGKGGATLESLSIALLEHG